MSPLESLAAEFASLTRQADEESVGSMQAFAAGRFDEWWTKRAQVIADRIKADGDDAIAHAGDGITSGGSNPGSSGGSQADHG